MNLKRKGFASLITVIHGKTHDNIENNLLSEKIQIERLSVKSNFKNTFHPESWAESLKIQVGDKTYIVIICHQEVNTPTDQTEVDGCMGFGNVIVFDKEEETEVGTVLLW